MIKFTLMLTSVMLFSAVYADNKASAALNEFAWEKRQLIVFANDLKHPQYRLFLNTKSEFQAEFDDRKLQVWYIIKGQTPKLESQVRGDLKNSDFYESYGVKDNEFKILLIGYDQGVKLRQNEVQIDDLLGEIDQMPMRIQEMSEG